MAVKKDSVSTRVLPTSDNPLPMAGGRANAPALPAFKLVDGTLGDYRLVCELGSGGMGTVYVARRTYAGGVERTVALKTLRRDLAGSTPLVEMFLNEARITARISHPYVCTVHDIGADSSVPFVTMDYLIGEPLSRVGPLMASLPSEVSLACIVRAVASLCEGLHAAHELRDEAGQYMHVVHRDISPDNLFVLYDGSVRVADFGIACTAEHQRAGVAPTLAGKTSYMSPEQIRGQSVDRRSDVWSMGVVLWELLAGRRLFRSGTDVASTVAVLERDIEPPSQHNALVPRGLDAIVKRALHRDREQRYPTARTLAADLERMLNRFFGQVSAARLGAWLDGLFPGCQEFRRTIVAHAEVQRTSLVHDAQPGEAPPEGSRTPIMVVQSGAPAQREVLTSAEVELLDSSVDFGSLSPSADGLGPAPLSTPFSRLPPPRFANNLGPANNNASLELDIQLSPESAPPVQPVPSTIDVAKSLLSTPRAKVTGAATLGLLVAVGAFALFSEEASEAAVLPASKPRPEARVGANEVPAPAPPEPAAQEPAAQAPPGAPGPVSLPLSAPPRADDTPIADRTTGDTAPQAAAARTDSADRPARRVRRDAPSEAAGTGEVYVFARSGEFFVILAGRAVHAPALLQLPLGTRNLTVREGASGPTKQVPVHPVAGSPSMLRLD